MQLNLTPLLLCFLLLNRAGCKLICHRINCFGLPGGQKHWDTSVAPGLLVLPSGQGWQGSALPVALRLGTPFW
jgi:hypothetical protein